MKIRRPPERRYSWQDEFRTELEYTGQLMVKIDQFFPRGARKTWKDGKRKRLEDQLNEVVVGIVRTAEALKLLEQERAEARKREKEAARIREGIKRREEEERRRRKQLEIDAAAWAKAEQIRAYVTTVEARLKQYEGGLNDQAKTWLTWAEAQADELDPLAGDSPPTFPVEFPQSGN